MNGESNGETNAEKRNHSMLLYLLAKDDITHHHDIVVVLEMF
jgi:hypothetical protein